MMSITFSMRHWSGMFCHSTYQFRLVTSTVAGCHTGSITAPLIKHISRLLWVILLTYNTKYLVLLKKLFPHIILASTYPLPPIYSTTPQEYRHFKNDEILLACHNHPEFPLGFTLVLFIRLFE